MRLPCCRKQVLSTTYVVHSHADIDMCMQTMMDLTFFAGIDIDHDGMTHVRFNNNQTMME